MVSSTTIYGEKLYVTITCNFTVVYVFGSEKEHIFTVNNRKLTFPELPVLHFNFFVVEMTIFLIFFLSVLHIMVVCYT